jgi:NTP pyrophosphatase (non-canonical NTP hydrolase)
MPRLPEGASLSQLQTYLAELCRERGWDQTDELSTWLLFTEEIGELAKAIRNQRKLYQEAERAPAPDELAHEMADVLSYFLQLANQLGVDLETAFAQKEAINQGREWKSQTD